MRLAALLVFFSLAGAAHAGIYNSSQAETVRSLSQRGDVFKFLETYRYVRSIGIDKVEKDNFLRINYFLCEALAGKGAPATLTVAQKLDYSAVLIRRKKFPQAIAYLMPMARQHGDVFLFQSHLAMAYWGSGQPGYDQRAVESLRDALGQWPKKYADLSKAQLAFISGPMGWNDTDYDFFRKTETHLLELMKRRLTEPPGKPFEAVDAIFGDLRFVNDAGKFEPGRLAEAERRKLPVGALDIVEQLTLWLPEDLRLYWLLGEMANTLWTPEQLAIDPKMPKAQRDRAVADAILANKNIKAANAIFDELVFAFQIRAPALSEHWQITREFAKNAKEPAEANDGFNDDGGGKDDKDPPSEPMNARVLATTFVAGVVVGIFAIWQFQEIRRRRRG